MCVGQEYSAASPEWPHDGRLLPKIDEDACGPEITAQTQDPPSDAEIDQLNSEGRGQ